MAHDVRALDPHVVHQQLAVARVVGDRQRAFDAGAAAEAGAVVGQQLVGVGEDRLVEERLGER